MIALRFPKAIASAIALIGGFMIGAPPASAGPAVPDSAFNNALPTGLNGYVYSVAWDGSGYLIAGSFTNGPGGTKHVFRIHRNGNPDTAFNGVVSAGLDNWVSSVVWDGSGYLIGGLFTNGPGGTSRVFRVKRDGTEDTAFNDAIHKGLNSYVSSVAWDGSGYLIAGHFTNGPGGTSLVFRVRRNGTADTDFNNALPTGLNSTVESVVWDGSGYLIGGGFTSGPGMGTDHKRVFRVKQDGTADSSFNDAIHKGLDGAVRSVAWDGSGYLIAGAFTNGPGTGVDTKRLFRVRRNGTADTAFNDAIHKGLSSWVYSVAWDGSGYLIGGSFSNGPDGTNRVFRVHQNGISDSAFNNAIHKGLDSAVFSVAWDGSGHLIGGAFSNGPGTGAGDKRLFRMANLAKPAQKPGSLRVKGKPTAKTYQITWKKPAGTGEIRPIANYHLTVKAKSKKLIVKKLGASKLKYTLKRKALLKLIKKKKVKAAKVHRLTAEVHAANPFGKGPVARKPFKLKE